MTNENLTILTVLIVSFLCSAGYAAFLEIIHDVYSPRQTWLAVVVGNGAIVDTLSILERQLGAALSAPIVFLVMVAWGAPIVFWQLWQNHQRTIQTNGNGGVHGSEA